MFVDDQFLIGVPQNALLDYELEKGKMIDLALYKRLSQIDSVSKLEQYFLRLLARRMYLTSELLQKGMAKDYDRVTIESVIQKFEDKGWINDREYTLAFARDKFNLNKWGPYKIKSVLKGKGVPSKFINEAVNDIFTKIDSNNILEQLIKKRKNHFLREGNPLKRKKKIMDYLLRKGFPSEAVSKHLDYLMEVIKE